jgi:hypothetical protein
LEFSLYGIFIRPSPQLSEFSDADLQIRVSLGKFA